MQRRMAKFSVGAQDIQSTSHVYRGIVLLLVESGALYVVAVVRKFLTAVKTLTYNAFCQTTALVLFLLHSQGLEIMLAINAQLIVRTISVHSILD
jgi:hypothetical protein